VPTSRITVALALIVAATPIEAQVVRGRLLESGSAQPILLGRVILLDTAFVAVAETVTDEQGRYVIEAPGPGEYWIAADRLGYQPMIDGILEMGEGGFLPADLYMRPEPLALEGISVTAERRRIERALSNAGFYDRKKAGFGRFIGPEDIERRNPIQLSDLLQGISAIRAGYGQAGEEFLCNGRQPRVFLDGAGVSFPRLQDPGVVSNAIIEEIVDLDAIAGIEVYTGPASLPLQWGGTISEDRPGGGSIARRSRPVCTILIWTKS
jgi:hypothetical protein